MAVVLPKLPKDEGRQVVVKSSFHYTTLRARDQVWKGGEVRGPRETKDNGCVENRRRSSGDCFHPPVFQCSLLRGRRQAN